MSDSPDQNSGGTAVRPIDWKKSSAFWNIFLGVQPLSTIAAVTSMEGFLDPVV